MTVIDRDDDTTLVTCETCGYRRLFGHILSTREVLRLRCNCAPAVNEKESR